MRFAPYVATALLFAMYAAPVQAAKRTVVVTPPPAKSILVFPFDNSAQVAPEFLESVQTLGQDTQLSLQTSLSAKGTCRALAFSERLPSVQRAVQEGTLKKEDLKGPFGLEKDATLLALKLAREVAADLMLVGAIDVRTGEVVKNVGLTGKTPEGTKSTSATDLISQAAADAVSKLAAEIAPPAGAAPAVVPPVRKKSSSRKTLLYLLLAAAAGIAISNAGDGTAPVDDQPPPPP
jgi:hypothetical protein